MFANESLAWIHITDILRWSGWAPGSAMQLFPVIQWLCFHATPLAVTRVGPSSWESDVGLERWRE